MEAQGGAGYSSYSFMTSALDGASDQLHVPAVFHPRGRTPGTHCTGGWLGLRAGLDTETREKILCHCRESNYNRSDRPVRNQDTILTELPRTT
jgi:hypothetical protein